MNFIGVTGTFAVVPTSVTTTLNIPTGKEVVAVETTSPDNITPSLAPLAYTASTSGVTFKLPITEYGVVVVTLKDSGPAVNRLPVANPDTLGTTKDLPVSFTAGQLLLNDSDPDGDPLTLTISSNMTARGGTITNSYLYAPPSGFVGTDYFNYTVSDGRGGYAEGSVTVTVTDTPVNRPPVAVNDTYGATQGITLTVAAPGLLANDSDPDGDLLSIASNTTPANGTVTVTGNGGFTYKPAGSFTGTDTFTYSITDGKGGNGSGTVTISVSPASLTPDTVYPSGVTITTGTLDYGTMASLRAADANTYDVRSVFVATENGGITDWYGSGKASGSPSAVTKITMTYSGQYSKAKVTQHISLFNYSTNSWELLDTRLVGNQDDISVTITPTNPRNYISSTGEIRTRIRGVRPGAQATTDWRFLCWANLMKWEVK